MRVSSQGQQDGHGIERQSEAIKNFCKAHKLGLRYEYRETITGTSELVDRTVLSDMLAFVETPFSGVKAVVVERIDRLARDLMVCELIIAEFRKRNIKLFAVDQGQLIDLCDDDSDPTRKLIRQLLGALAEWEKSMLVLKLKRARVAKKEKTGRCEGVKPYGQHDGEDKLLAVIYSGRDEGWSYQKIADYLNHNEMRTRKGTSWNKGSIQKIVAAARRTKA